MEPVAVQVASGSSGLRVRWRTLEWLGTATALFLQTGAIFPLLLSAPDGALDEHARSMLRLLTLPVYAISIGLLARQPGQFAVALRRNLPLVVLLSLICASVLWSVSPSVTLRRIIGLAFSLMLSTLIAIRFSPRQIMLLIAMALGPSMALSIALAGVSPSMAFMPLDGDMRGVFLHKNVLGWASAVCALAATAVIADGPRPLRRPAIALLGMSLLCLALSQSMTSLLATLAAPGLVAFYLAMARRRGVSRVAFILAALTGAAAALALVTEFLVPVLAALGRDATLTGRVPLWHLADVHIGRRLVLGHGYQAFWSEANGDAWVIWAEIGWMAPHVHNGYRETLLGLGAVGLAALFAVVAKAAAQGASLVCREPDGGWLWLNVFLGMFLFMNLSESIFLTQNDFLSTIFTTAVIAFGLRARRAKAPPTTRRGAPVSAAIGYRTALAGATGLRA